MAEPGTSLDAIDWIRNNAADADTDVLREMVATFAQILMGADADAVCGAAYGERSPDRQNQRNGYRPRTWDTRAGTIDVQVPKLRQGSYFPDWLLEPRRRAERALTSVVAECYLRGVSTRRVEGLVETMGIDRLSKSQVSEMAKSLDEVVTEFRNRPLDAGPYTFVWVDALTQKVREGGRVVNVACVIATGVNVDGHREVLGMDLITSEDGAGWTAFLRSLVARGLSGVALVTSDAHVGLKDAIAAVLPGASWQRCRTHYMRNLLTKVPKSAQSMVATLVRTIFAQPDADSVRRQHDTVIEQLIDHDFDQAAEMLADAADELLAFACFPKVAWTNIWSNNPQERLNKEVRRRTDVVGIFPDRPSVIRLVGAVLAEQNDEWAVTRRYLSPDILAKARLNIITNNQPEEEPLGNVNRDWPHRAHFFWPHLIVGGGGWCGVGRTGCRFR